MREGWVRVMDESSSRLVNGLGNALILLLNDLPRVILLPRGVLAILVISVFGVCVLGHRIVFFENHLSIHVTFQVIDVPLERHWWPCVCRCH